MNTKNTILSLIVGLTLFGCTGTSQNSTEPTDSDTPEDNPSKSQVIPEIPYATPAVEKISPPTFSLYGEGAIIELGEIWDSLLLSPGAIIYHNGLFHMLYHGHADLEFIEPLESVGYAVSVDGYEWVRASEEPVQFTGQPEYELGSLFISSLLPGNDGGWVIYFSARGSSMAIGGSFIGRATAPDIAGPWTIDPAPALLPGNVARWDGGGISNPQVFRTQTEYIMFFNGTVGDPRFFEPTQVGMATSPDGITWTKYDDPETTRRLHEDSDPVFKISSDFAWDSTSMGMASIMQTQEGFAMLYTGTVRKDMRSHTMIGLATSVDGLTWERYAQNPILNQEELMQDYSVSSLVWLYNQDLHLLYFRAFHKSLYISEIYLATSD